MEFQCIEYNVNVFKAKVWPKLLKSKFNYCLACFPSIFDIHFNENQ